MPYQTQIRNFNHCFSYPTVEGELMFIESDDFPSPGNLARNVVHDMFQWTECHKRLLDDLPEYQESRQLLPIIVNKQEPIDVGDWLYLTGSKEVNKAVDRSLFLTKDTFPFQAINKEYCWKVIAMPENFSNAYIQWIINNKPKSGHKVGVKVEESYTSKRTKFYRTYLDDNGNVTIKTNPDLKKIECDKYVHGDHAANIAGDPLLEQLIAAFNAGWEAKENTNQ